MDKLELLCYLQNIDDKSGGFKKKESIKKRYPEINVKEHNINYLEIFSHKIEEIISTFENYINDENRSF